MAAVNMAAIDAIIGGNPVSAPAQAVNLLDLTTGNSGPGGYTISLTSSGTYTVTYGEIPNESTAQLNVCRAVLLTNGDVMLSDLRNLNVTAEAVNATIMSTPNVDGSYLQDGVVTDRTLAPDILAKLGRTVRMKMCSADFTPTGTGTDVGGVSIVPYDPSQPGEVSITWTVTDIIFRVETAASSGTTSVKIQHSTSSGAFSNVGYLNTTSCDIASGAYEQTTKPAVIAVTSVNSGDKLMPEYTALGSGAAGFTLYIVLQES